MKAKGWRFYLLCKNDKLGHASSFFYFKERKMAKVSENEVSSENHI